MCQCAKVCSVQSQRSRTPVAGCLESDCRTDTANEAAFRLRISPRVHGDDGSIYSSSVYDLIFFSEFTHRFVCIQMTCNATSVREIENFPTVVNAGNCSEEQAK